jgi:hypothetical protein
MKFGSASINAMPVVAKKSSAKPASTGKVVRSVPGFVLVKKPRTSPRGAAEVSEQTATLMPKVAKALRRPGIGSDVVFKGRTHNVYSYSVDTSDTSRVIRVGADGRRTVGRLVGDRFIPVKVA